MTKIETVSSHFRYTEEYVLDHTPAWIDRKYWQALEEKFDNSQTRVLEGFKSIALLVDSIFNKGANYSEFIQGSFKEAMKMEDKKEETGQYITGQWWMK